MRVRGFLEALRIWDVQCVCVYPVCSVPNPLNVGAIVYDLDIAAVVLAFCRIPMRLAASIALWKGARVTVKNAARFCVVSVCLCYVSVCSAAYVDHLDSFLAAVASFNRLSVCLSVCLFLCLSACLSVCPSVRLSVCWFVCLSVFLFVCL